jgi:hypothetical protein
MTINPRCVAYAQIKVAMRLAHEELTHGIWPVIEQIDVSRAEDGSGVIVTMWDESGEMYLVHLNLPAAEVQAFKRRHWMAALQNVVKVKDDDDEGEEA